MPKGPALTKAEREEIAALRASNLSARDIAKRIDRSKTVVLNFLKSPATYGTTKRSGRKRALSKAQEDQIFRALSAGRLSADADGGGGGGGGGGVASAGKLSAERVKQEFGLPLSTRRVQQLLSDWRRSTRKALDQQHALVEEQQEEEEEEAEQRAEGGGEDTSTSDVVAPRAVAPPSLSITPPEEDDINHVHDGGDDDQDEDHGNDSLLESMPAPLVLEEDDATLGMDESRPTEEVLV